MHGRGGQSVAGAGVYESINKKQLRQQYSLGEPRLTTQQPEGQNRRAINRDLPPSLESIAKSDDADNSQQETANLDEAASPLLSKNLATQLSAYHSPRSSGSIIVPITEAQ